MTGVNGCWNDFCIGEKHDGTEHLAAGGEMFEAMSKEQRAEFFLTWRYANQPLDRESTDYVDLWINNDSEYYYEALKLAQDDDIDGLSEYVLESLSDAPEGSSAWYTNRELSANDRERIDWAEIAETLVGE